MVKNKSYTAAYFINAKTLNEFVEKNGNKNPRKLWLDFETWLHKHYSKTLPDLSWNEYIERSKEYNNERIESND